MQTMETWCVVTVALAVRGGAAELRDRDSWRWEKVWLVAWIEVTLTTPHLTFPLLSAPE